MPKNLILPSLALLLITACSSSGDQDASAEKTFQVTPTLGSLKSNESVPGSTDNTAMPVEFTSTEILTYQGFAGITPKFADDTPQDQQFAISGNAAIELDFTDAEGVLNGQITDLREERLNENGLALVTKDGELDLTGKSIAEINDLYQIVNTFDGDIEIAGTALRSGQLTAQLDATLTPTQGDTSPMRIQEAMYGFVYSSEGTPDTLKLTSAIFIDEKKDPAIFPGSMTSENATYNHEKINIIIIASEPAE
jgi:hypothetical protein